MELATAISVHIAATADGDDAEANRAFAEAHQGYLPPSKLAFYDFMQCTSWLEKYPPAWKLDEFGQLVNGEFSLSSSELVALRTGYSVQEQKEGVEYAFTYEIDAEPGFGDLSVVVTATVPYHLQSDAEIIFRRAFE